MYMFNIGDRIRIKPPLDKHKGVIIQSNHEIDGTYQIEWDIIKLAENITRHSRSTWVSSNDIELDIQEIRDKKLNELGI